MTTLSKNNHTAYIVGATVYLANNGKIFKQFGVSTFNRQGWAEVTPPTEEAAMITMIADFNMLTAVKQAQRIVRQAAWEEEIKRRAAAERAHRKEMLTGLWNWRKGRATAFLVVTSEQENSDRSNDYENDTTLFFNKEKATAFFEEMKKTAPENVGYYFITDLYELPTTEDALEITTLLELEHEITNRGQNIRFESYAEPIPEGHVIITLFHRQHGSEGRYERAEYPLKNGYWGSSVYHSAQTTLADLAARQDRSFTYYQTTLSIADAVGEYGEKLISDLSLSKEEAIAAGVDLHLIEEYYTREQESEEVQPDNSSH